MSSTPDNRAESTPNEELVRQKIDRLVELGLPLEFSAGLEEVARSDDLIASSVAMSSLELLLKIREDYGRELLVNREYQMSRLIAHKDTLPKWTVSEVLCAETPNDGTPLHWQPAGSFFTKLMAERSDGAVTQYDFEKFLREVFQIYPTLFEKDLLFTPVFAEILLHTRGIKDKEIPKALENGRRAAPHVTRANFVKHLHERGYGPAKLREMLKEVRETTKAQD